MRGTISASRNDPKTLAVEVKTTNYLTAETEEPVAASAITLHTIENKKGTKLIVSDYGAAAIALWVADKNGVLADVLIGYENPQDYFTDEFYLGTVVGRYANRISGDTVMIGDQPYKLFTKDGNYHLHGGKIGFNKKFFQAFSFRNENESGIVFSYTSPHLEEGFPGNLTLNITYTLSDDNAWTVTYKAVSDRDTIINLTQHAYFNLSGDAASKIDDHELTIYAEQYLPVNGLQVPTGIVGPVKNTVFDFTKAKRIGEDIMEQDEQLLLSNGYDHSFVLETTHSAGLKHAASVREPVSGRTLQVYTTEPAVHFYSGNYLQNIKGKEGVVSNQRSGFCLETQHFPDAPKHPHFPSTVLKAGEEFYSKTVFVFGC